MIMPHKDKLLIACIVIVVFFLMLIMLYWQTYSTLEILGISNKDYAIDEDSYYYDF